MSRISVLGSGAWGTAIALALDRRGGHEVSLWAHSPELAQEIIDAEKTASSCPAFRCRRASMSPATASR